MKYLVKPAENMQGDKGYGVFTTKPLYWYETEREARIDANVLELKHLQEKMDKCLETLGELDPETDPSDHLA